MAVLTCTNDHAAQVAEALKNRKIEYRELLRSTSPTRAAAGALELPPRLPRRARLRQRSSRRPIRSGAAIGATTWNAGLSTITWPGLSRGACGMWKNMSRRSCLQAQGQLPWSRRLAKRTNRPRSSRS